MRFLLLFAFWSLGVGVASGTADAWATDLPPAMPPAPATHAPLTSKEIVVTATRTHQPFGRVPGSPTVLDAEQIARTPFRGGHQVDDLLRYVPGLQPSNLGSRFNHPTAQAISVRGLGSRRALVLLDGVPLNDGFGGWINWGRIPDDVARIEVVPGGGSNLYGTWAMGGVIQIFTDPPAFEPRFQSRHSAGNLNTYTQSVMAGYGTDRTDLKLGYRWYHTNGFVTVPDEQRGPVDRTNDSRHQNFTGRLAFALNANTRLTISGGLFREDRTFGTTLSLASRTLGSAAVGLEGETNQGHRWETKLFAQLQTFRNLTSQVTPESTVRLGENRERIQIITHDDFGGLGQWTVTLTPRHRLILGTDARAIIGQSDEQLFIPAGFSLAKGKQVGWGVFGEWIAVPTDRLTVIPSLRWDWWKNFDGVVTKSPGGLPDNVVSVLNPKLAMQYRITEHLQLGASIYQAFRAPTLNELYRNFSFGGPDAPTFFANENLSPERLTGGEAKIEVELLPDRRLNLRVTGHYTEVKDQILFISEGSDFRRQNVGRSRTLGAEVDLKFRPVEILALTAGYGYADSAIKSFRGDKAREGKRIPNVSRHQLVLGVTLGDRDWGQVSVFGRYLSRQYADVSNTQPVADFVLLDASLRKRIAPSLELFLDAENLTDREYIVTQTGAIKTLGAPLLVTGGISLVQ
ncbi:TonB-dependent receptor [Nitrospiraceae bacterium AH_259_D15_M11_P09]|nr:TonB-dependent receptor [Nitrospiraceae bacterium AH_259_D15_M11_P09]